MPRFLMVLMALETFLWWVAHKPVLSLLLILPEAER